MTQRQSQVNVLSSEDDQNRPKSLVSINKFAQICRTTPRTIRFYDQKGLLEPVYIDKWTNYRYYDPRQARDFLMIRFMQNFRLPLAQVKQNIELGGGDRFLESRLESLRDEIEERRKEVVLLEKLNKLFFGNPSLKEVFQKQEIGPFNLFSLKVNHGSYDSIQAFREKLLNEAKKLGIEGKEDMVLYMDKGYKPKDTSLEFALICKKNYSKDVFSLKEGYSFKSFPKIKALVYEYQGPRFYLILIYHRLFLILEDFKIKLKANELDINMDELSNSLDHRTKLVFPI